MLVFHTTELFRVSGINLQTASREILVVMIKINHSPCIDLLVWDKGLCLGEKEDSANFQFGVNVFSILNLEGGRIALPNL